MPWGKSPSFKWSALTIMMSSNSFVSHLPMTSPPRTAWWTWRQWWQDRLCLEFSGHLRLQEVQPVEACWCYTRWPHLLKWMQKDSLNNKPQTWTMMSHNGARSTSLRTPALTLGKPMMSWLTTYMPLPTNATSQMIREKEWHVQFQIGYVLGETYLIKKPLELDLATTAKIL